MTTIREAMRRTGANGSSGPNGRREPRSLAAIGRVAAPVVALVLLTMLPPVAAAAPVKDPAVDQYVESVPAADGGNGSDPRSGSGGLPPRVARQIEQSGGRDAEALKAVGSSPALGAPSKERGGREARSATRAEPQGNPSALDAIASAAGGDSNSGGWLLAGIALLTVALSATALARRRSLTR